MDDTFNATLLSLAIRKDNNNLCWYGYRFDPTYNVAKVWSHCNICNQTIAIVEQNAGISDSYNTIMEHGKNHIKEYNLLSLL